MSVLRKKAARPEGMSEPRLSLFKLFQELNLPAFTGEQKDDSLFQQACEAILSLTIEKASLKIANHVLNQHLSPLFIEYAKRCGEIENTAEGDQRFLALVQPILDNPDVLNFILIRIAPWIGAFGVERAEKLLERPLRREIWDLRQKHFNVRNHDAFISAMKQLDSDFYFRRGIEVLAALFLHYKISPPEAFQLNEQELEAAQKIERYAEDVQSDMEFIAKLKHPSAPEILFSLFDCGLDQLFRPKLISEILGKFFSVFTLEKMKPAVLNDSKEARARGYMFAFQYTESNEVIQHLVGGQIQQTRPKYVLEDLLLLLIRQNQIHEIAKIAETTPDTMVKILHYFASAEPDGVSKIVAAWLTRNPELSITKKGELLRTLYLTHRQHDVDPTRLAEFLHYPDENLDEYNSWDEVILSLLGKCRNRDEASIILAHELHSDNDSRKQAAYNAITENGLIQCSDAVKDYLNKEGDEWKSVKLALLHANGHDFNSPFLQEALKTWVKQPVPTDLRKSILKATREAPIKFIQHFLHEIRPVLHNVTLEEVSYLVEMVGHAECGEYRDWLVDRLRPLKELRKRGDYLLVQLELDGDIEDVTEEVLDQCKKWLLSALVQIDTNWAIEHMPEYPDLLVYIAIHSLDHDRLCFEDTYLDELGKRHLYGVRPTSLIQDKKVPLPAEDLTLFWEKAPNGDYRVTLKHRDEVIHELDLARHYHRRVTNQWKLLDLMIRKHPNGPTFWDILECTDPKVFDLVWGDQSQDTVDEVREGADLIGREIKEETDGYAHYEQTSLFTRLKSDEKITEGHAIFPYLRRLHALVGDLRKNFPMDLRSSVIDNPGSQNSPSKWGKPFTRFTCKIMELSASEPV